MSSSGAATRFIIDIAVEKDGKEYHAYCPALKGLHTSGRTEAEAVRNAVDAAGAYIRSLIKHGDPIPVGIVERKGPGSKKVKREELELMPA